MNTQVERLEHNMVKLTVTVPAEDFKKAITKAYHKTKAASIFRVSVREKHRSRSLSACMVRRSSTMTLLIL